MSQIRNNCVHVAFKAAGYKFPNIDWAEARQVLAFANGHNMEVIGDYERSCFLPDGIGEAIIIYWVDVGNNEKALHASHIRNLAEYVQKYPHLEIQFVIVIPTKGENDV
jgi:hypothetical protein